MYKVIDNGGLLEPFPWSPDVPEDAVKNIKEDKHYVN
jgi:hypothetical protein